MAVTFKGKKAVASAKAAKKTPTPADDTPAQAMDLKGKVKKQAPEKLPEQAESGNSMKALLAAFRKEYGEEVGSFGGPLVNSERLTTGMLPLDMALGGGFPRGKASIIYGPESSGKTNVALLLIAQHQRQYPALICVYVDVENSWDPEWAAKLGVDVAKVVVLKSAIAEVIVNMVESALRADECGIVVVDSLAALLTVSESDASAERAQVGGSTLAIGKLTRKSSQSLMEAEKHGRYPTLIYINQIRSKVGLVYGNPETMPGGRAPLFQASMIVRVYGKNLMDPKVSTAMPVAKDVAFTCTKWKCPILAVEGKFEMVMLPHKGLKPGQCADYNTVSTYLKTFGQVEQLKKGWKILDEEYPVLDDFKTKLYGDPQFGHKVRSYVVEQVFSASKLLETSAIEEVAAE